LKGIEASSDGSDTEPISETTPKRLCNVADYLLKRKDLEQRERF
jgi:hypothetical protein